MDYILDPAGDVELILQNPNKQEFSWDSDGMYDCILPKPVPEPEEQRYIQKKKKKRGQNFWADPTPEDYSDGTAEQPIEEQPAMEPPVSEQQTTETINAVSQSNEIRILVSSRHLCLASPVFATFLSPDWIVNGEEPQGRRTIKESSWDSDAFLIVLYALHGRHYSVRRTVDLETLAKIATIVDYFDCREPIQIFADGWIPDLAPGCPTFFGRDAMLWWSISWVFQHDNMFDRMTALARTGSRGPIDNMGLPLPESLLSKPAFNIDLDSRLCPKEF